MRKISAVSSTFALLMATPAIAQDTQTAEYPSPNAIVEAAPPSDWVTIAPSDLLVMDLAPDAQGNPRRVIIQLMPEPFSQGWIRNIRKLAAARWWDGTSINRVQDNYVVQWGDASEKKALPEGLETVPESEYLSKLTPIDSESSNIYNSDPVSDATEAYRDDLYGKSLFGLGWPLGSGNNSLWPIHCYGAVGVGRNYSPDTGSGAELYTVIGHAPRHLDRNIAVVGRIVEGIEHLSSLPRGKGQLGFYEDASKRVPITSLRLGDALAEDAPPAFEYLDTNSAIFAKYADARANRRDPFFIKPAGGADICNIPVPVRRVTGE
ncbi:peptidylprolyl isomerase [uncultured Parasphingorhabdus sp.]|uniref:peptidylprolyl isomerase n=1 Tax=uncultured Parasphingorhabdus sp. TaxID=2709694 RepID=UPI002AA64BBC|nr:peptidylprolyl isomerase [uncultured Parasphingorhabdus sp.]